MQSPVMHHISAAFACHIPLRLPVRWLVVREADDVLRGKLQRWRTVDVVELKLAAKRRGARLHLLQRLLLRVPEASQSPQETGRDIC